MRYLDGVKTIAPTEADNALVLGTALHTGIERGVDAAIQQYCFSYPIITDEHFNQIMKLETVIPMATAALPPGGAFEVPISTADFSGLIDYLVPVHYSAGDTDLLVQEAAVVSDEFDLYDFKYSNNVSSYRNSPQLHLYKHFWEQINPGKRIRNLYFLFVPKVNIKQKSGESLDDYRQRIESELDRVAVRVEPVKYDVQKVIDWLLRVKATYEEREFAPERSYLCRYCEFQEYCEKGWDYFMKLPENKRRNIEAVTKRVIWIYGAPFCGKTTFANGFPDPLMLNTDGNYRFVDAPVIPIRDEVTVEGRGTRRKMAWEIFKETIDELEKKENTFKTVIVDLLEDTYEHCRQYMYKQMNITHESDDSFRAWDKVRGEFLNTLKRLMNLDYENIVLISHEDTSRDLTRKGGDKISAIKPNIQDKIANKVAGMVDVVARIVADAGTYTFNFKSNEVIFGGGRLRVEERSIPLSVEALFAVYDDANKNKGNYTPAAETPSTGRRKGRGKDKPPAPPAEETPAPANENQEDGSGAKTDNPPPPSSGEETPPWEGDKPADDPPLPKCPDAERIFQQFNESKGEIPLCPKIDAGHHCHKENGPDGCPLLDRPAPAADPAPDAAPDAAESDPPRRKRKART